MTLNELKLRIKPLADRIDALSLRERGIVFVAVLGVLYFASANLLFAPVKTEQERLQKQLQSKREQIQSIESQVQIVLTGGIHDSDPAKRAHYNALQTNLRMIDGTLQKVTTGLVPPKEMARLVEQMLVKNRGLQVLKVESLPAASLIDENPAPTPGDHAKAGRTGPAAGLMVYKHGMRIELRGGYMDILRYLHALEGLPWKVFWGQATLQAEEYPATSKLTLLIYTLSTQDSWITL